MKNFVFLKENFNPMETATIRKRLHKYIDTTNEKMLKMIYAMVKVDEQDTPAVPKSHYEELHKRRDKYLAGETKSYTWEEVKQMARQQKK